MGRHSVSYIAAQQSDSTGSSKIGSSAGYVGRVGLLAVALGIGAAVAGGSAIASAEPAASSEASSAQSADHSRTTKSSSTRPSRDTADDESETRTDTDPGADDPGSTPPSSLDGVRRGGDRDDRDGAEPDTDIEAEEAADEEAPSADDETSTEYGDIGKWMLDSSGDIADYGGLPYQGRTVLEAINVVIVDPTSRSSLEATWRLNAAMRRAGFPPRLIHSTGFRGLIDGERYRQQPRGLLVGYSDDFFLLPNNHGRIFGPDPVETATGYVWSGSFSTEEFVFYQGLPRHGYISSNAARDALAAQLIASGRATSGGMVSLDNAYNTATTTTGDHDGFAVVVTLNGLRAATAARDAAALVARRAGTSRTCVDADVSAASPALSCGTAVAPR
ncbi:hypothetical protein PDG61_03660 [Mycolicibacterium sp. BiH015]|uniref:hypothetical protein n=1 Tax=Mycolicibacterium sp. BiH015 TaxID=3018808 RepID=UPI0022E41DE2|nr:hypothetical protein [Mycolicibacterium sp. BiH015]MDA2889998.1 hypothetical protein [Mycolicibacterium sp. BiH015]